MKILTKLGLVNPRIEVVTDNSNIPKTGLNKDAKKNSLVPKGQEGNVKIILICDNAFSTPRITRRFSYFERVFQDFLVLSAHEGIFDKFKKVLIEEEGEQKGTQNVKAQLVNFLEMMFVSFLEENENAIQENFDSLSKDSFPKILWKKAKTLNIIQTQESDIQNGFLIFIVIGENVAEKKKNLHNDKEIQSIIENIAYKNELQTSSLNAYSFVASDADLIRANIPLAIKDKISKGYAKVTLIPTNDYTKANKGKIVYVNKLYSFSNQNEK
ncbi:hypothetical protein [Poseidonibacter ostreae]|uniref:Uncharacterized protein n=1 Tax=Poseidonibacter ostreae TaxID=2654171 RepID=A0A6L4WWS2_9BACT|nr:hypothetical protein [Poseidonibacter ostreae]KAB7891317.1 hypothetical protein GBG19_00340 [Poseidonibacter ostreae]